MKECTKCGDYDVEPQNIRILEGREVCKKCLKHAQMLKHTYGKTPVRSVA